MEMAADTAVVQEIVTGDDLQYGGEWGNCNEIEEVFEPPLESIWEEVEGLGFPSSFDDAGEEAIYVAVGNQSEETSMNALLWALNHALISPSTVVNLVLVFPETKYIPSPLGMLPVSQVNTLQKESYMVQEMAKRIDHLQQLKISAMLTRLKWRQY